MKKLIGKTARKLGLTSNQPALGYNPLMASSPSSDPNHPHVLLAYVLDPFLLEDRNSIPTSHTHFIESLAIARAFNESGFNVDIIDYRNYRYKPEKNYKYFVSARTHLEKIKPRLNPDCITIAHFDTSHFVFNNWSAWSRCHDLLKNKGLTCPSIRVIENNRALEECDYGIVLGNQHTLSTYDYQDKPLFTLNVPGISSIPYNENKNFETCKKNFLWMGSSGLVHKGLDILLDVFSELPDYHLYICGPIKEDKLFAKLFKQQLFKTDNIHTIGWTDISSESFKDITDNCLGLIYPSCAEGQAGCVVNCLHFGLIPIISKQSGVDVEDFGVELKDNGTADITENIQRLANLDTNTLQSMSRKAWLRANELHTDESYVSQYKSIIDTIGKNH